MLSAFIDGEWSDRATHQPLHKTAAGRDVVLPMRRDATGWSQRRAANDLAPFHAFEVAHA